MGDRGGLLINTVNKGLTSDISASTTSAVKYEWILSGEGTLFCCRLEQGSTHGLTIIHHIYQLEAAAQSLTRVFIYLEKVVLEQIWTRVQL